MSYYFLQHYQLLVLGLVTCSSSEIFLKLRISLAGFPGRGIRPKKGLYLHRTAQHGKTCLLRNSIPRYHYLLHFKVKSLHNPGVHNAVPQSGNVSTWTHPWKPFSLYSPADTISGTPNLVTCKYVRLITYRSSVPRLGMHGVCLHSYSLRGLLPQARFNQWEPLADPGSWKVHFFVKPCLHDASWLAQVKCEECTRRRFMQVQ
jgi:hypothetical protein